MGSEKVVMHGWRLQNEGEEEVRGWRKHLTGRPEDEDTSPQSVPLQAQLVSLLSWAEPQRNLRNMLCLSHSPLEELLGNLCAGTHVWKVSRHVWKALAQSVFSDKLKD